MKRFDKVVNLITKNRNPRYRDVTSFHGSDETKSFQQKIPIVLKKWPHSLKIFSETTSHNKSTYIIYVFDLFRGVRSWFSVKLRANIREAFQEHPLFIERDVSGIALWSAMEQMHSHKVFIVWRHNFPMIFLENTPFSYTVKSHSDRSIFPVMT